MISQCLADQLFASAFGFGKYIDLLATDESRYFAQLRPIIVKYQLKMASYLKRLKSACNKELTTIDI